MIFCTHNIFAQKSWINVSELDQGEQWIFVYEVIESPTAQGSPEETIAKEAKEILYKQDNNIEERMTELIIIEDK